MSKIRPAAVVVLAAGEGTRMRSCTTPKVLHEICGRSLVGHAVAAARRLQPAHLVVVVGHARERVAAHLSVVDPGARIVVQEPQRGTGHAVRIAFEALAGDGIALDGPVVVIPGDGPLLTPDTLGALLDAAVVEQAGAVVLTAELPDPTGYGRIVRDAEGAVVGIVEQKDASPEQRAIREVAVSVYAFAPAPLRAAVQRLTADNAQAEEYLTDVVSLLVAEGASVAAVPAPDWRETLGVNDRLQLAQARRILNARLLEQHMREGATIVDPETTWVDVDVVIEPDAIVHPGTHLRGSTRLAAEAQVGPECTLTDTDVGPGAVVRNATCDRAIIGPRANVGPYTYLRPGTRLGRGAKAGGFVEMKNATVGEGSKVPHLSYVGDATIGARSNIGAATVFVNYDGATKHSTVVGDDVRIGSDTMLVGPVTIGDRAYTAAGSVITMDVPAGALGVGRARQRNVEGWVERRRGPAAAAGPAGGGAPE